MSSAASRPEGDSPFTLEDADNLRRSVGTIVRAVRDRTTDESDGQIETLGFLMRDGAQSIAHLARRRAVRHQSMSSIVADLENRGLVARDPDPADARGVLISLTGAGTAVVTESRETRSVVLRDAAMRALVGEDLALLARLPALLDALSAELA
ncbi:DNA-binding MarR family transcriptional regulator [Frondihabitans sp. PhB188]|uniref:MarR family winged helix-turn-helix transcriptional regulator n=1 Tax=Frondihabitans sp. PhB188 TaxID=2485200 RepID=UPI000F48C373|nr:MarR family transcriptional regulator [Frondihabitans sp. PhB188]ROQ40125.1 DNA-binding MarR family transcriptional regulator [Frondihabitans sp. PhB188]